MNIVRPALRSYPEAIITCVSAFPTLPLLVAAIVIHDRIVTIHTQ